MEVILKDVTPVNTQILTEAVKYKEAIASSGIFTDLKKLEHNYKYYQKVLKVGPMVRSVKPGDTVMLDDTQYMRIEHREDQGSLRELVNVRETKSKVDWPVLEVNGEERMLLQERDVLYICEIEEK